MMFIIEHYTDVHHKTVLHYTDVHHRAHLVAHYGMRYRLAMEGELL